MCFRSCMSDPARQRGRPRVRVLVSRGQEGFEQWLHPVGCARRTFLPKRGRLGRCPRLRFCEEFCCGVGSRKMPRITRRIKPCFSRRESAESIAERDPKSAKSALETPNPPMPINAANYLIVNRLRHSLPSIPARKNSIFSPHLLAPF